MFLQNMTVIYCFDYCRFFYNICMEYDKKLVSLYDNKNFMGVPKCVVEIFKQGNRCLLKVSLWKGGGWFFVFVQNKCYFLDLSKTNDFIFDDDFFNKNDYLFVIRTKRVCLYGKIGEVSSFENKLSKIEIKFKELCSREKWRESCDKNLIVEKIVSKMFGASENLFFEQLQSRLQNLFSANKRCVELEKKIRCSKFVELGKDGDKMFVGIVYKNNVAFAIAFGRKVCFDELVLQSDNFYSFYETENSPSNGICLVCRLASDADMCFV